MSVSKILNSLLKPLGCKVVRLEGEQQVHNFDPLERNDVETLEKLWGDPEFRAKYLSPTRQRLYEVVLAELQGLEVYGPACKLLDVGCGPGFFPRLIMDRGFEGQVFGCDFSEQAISLSSSLIPEGEFFKQKTAYEISACIVGREMCIRDRMGRRATRLARKVIKPIPMLAPSDSPQVFLITATERLTASIGPVFSTTRTGITKKVVMDLSLIHI